MVGVDLRAHTHTHTPSRALLTFSHVPLLVRVPAYGSHERPRGKLSRRSPAKENVILTAWMEHTRTESQTGVYKYSGRTGSGSTGGAVENCSIVSLAA